MGRGSTNQEITKQANEWMGNEWEDVEWEGLRPLRR